MQWLMLQQDLPQDFVIATGRQISVRDFVDQVAKQLGMEMSWSGVGVEETGTVASVNEPRGAKYINVGDAIVRVDPRYFRPAEVETLLGDPSLANK